MWGRASSERSSVRLGERRRTRRRVWFIVFAILLLLLLSATIYGLNQREVRIAHVNIIGGDSAFSLLALSTMVGDYMWLIPRDSILFFPEDRIRREILADHSDIAAVSISRSSLTSISIKIDTRTPIARWCGLVPTAGVEEYCYLFDANGFVFALAKAETETINSFSLYAPLAGDTLEPLMATLAQANQLPAVFDFARQLSTLGSPVIKVVIRDGEVDDYLTNGTRITYLLGNEQNAFTALVSAGESLRLSQGNIDYVDLRFDGKVYLKKKQAESSRQ